MQKIQLTCFCSQIHGVPGQVVEVDDNLADYLFRVRGAVPYREPVASVKKPKPNPLPVGVKSQPVAKSEPEPERPKRTRKGNPKRAST